MSDTAAPQHPVATLSPIFTALRNHVTTLAQTSSALGTLADELEAAHKAILEERASLLKKVEEAEAATAAAMAAAEEAEAEAEAAKKLASPGVAVNVSVGVRGGFGGGNGGGVKTRHPGCDACPGEKKEMREGEEGSATGTMVKGNEAGPALEGGDVVEDGWGSGWGKVDAKGASGNIHVRWGGLC